MPDQTAPLDGTKEAPRVEPGSDLSGLPAGDRGQTNGREVVIYARFRPNGLIDTINHRPEGFDPQAWFDHLCLMVPACYQPLAGGRGAFRLQGDVFDRIWQEVTAG